MTSARRGSPCPKNDLCCLREIVEVHTLAARMGPPPDTFPGTPDHPQWQVIRRLYFYDPAPTLRQLHVPTLALFGELDNNILAEYFATIQDWLAKRIRGFKARG